MTMALDTDIDLFAPVTEDTVLEVRSGRMKKLSGVSVESGIDKAAHAGAVQVDALGILGDEHDLTFHGGVDKAIHGYCATHYRAWQAEYPAAAARFVPGGFGENLVFARMNERNVCIGDVVSIGGSGSGTGTGSNDDDDDDEEEEEAPLLLQVSLPRQPCFKLNHRFGLKGFAPTTWRTSRTGWYYRVLRPGRLAAGDTARVVRRPHPGWTIERVQEYLHRRPPAPLEQRIDVVEELAAIEEFGAECRNQFRARVAKHRARERRAAGGGGKEEQWADYRVTRKERQTPRIVSLDLEAVRPDPDAEALAPGSHVKIRLPNGLVRAYSVVSGDRNAFQLGVALEASSRGASRYLHGLACAEGGSSGGSSDNPVIQVGRFTGAVPLAKHASAHVFVAGGVGITAFLAVLDVLRRSNYAYALHYAVRSADEVPFREALDRLGGAANGTVAVYDGSRGQRLDVRAVVAAMPWNAHARFCGPRRMMDEAAAAVREAGLGPGEAHFEAFAADASGDAFEVRVANRGDRVLRVAGEETLLEVLRGEFGQEDEGGVGSSCEVGNCGTCRVSLRGGRVDHRGTALSEEEKGTGMLACVSRGVGRICIEI